MRATQPLPFGRQLRTLSGDDGYAARMAESFTNPEELQRQVNEIDWYHMIDLGHGVRTTGIGVQSTGAEILPDVNGRTVLDIGAWDGKFSFLAEQRGAQRVVALDHYAWGVDLAARDEYWNECVQNGMLADLRRDETDFWQPDLPGRRGFELASTALNSNVEPVVGDFAKIDLERLGQFDVVLYLGVLYHVKEPLTCLERIRSITNEVAVIETEAVHFQNLEHEVLLQFHAGSSLRGDLGNWFVVTMEALRNMCIAAGFREIRVISGPPEPVPRNPARERLGRWIGKLPTPKPSAPSVNYRAVIHAFV